MPTGKRLRTLALLLPLFGTLLFLPPYISIFDQPSFIWNVPMLHVYIFAIWAIGILLTAVLSRRLVGRDMDDGDITGPPRDDG